MNGAQRILAWESGHLFIQTSKSMWHFERLLSRIALLNCHFCYLCWENNFSFSKILKRDTKFEKLINDLWTLQIISVPNKKNLSTIWATVWTVLGKIYKNTEKTKLKYNLPESMATTKTLYWGTCSLSRVWLQVISPDTELIWKREVTPLSPSLST